MTPQELLDHASRQLAAGCSVMTLVRPRGSGTNLLGRRGPRGEIVCENSNGARVVAYDARKVVQFMMQAKVNGEW